ncbi:MAG: DUF1501 domain-containing protein [Planctomycetales bacterium]
MLSVGDQSIRNCRGSSRRDFLIAGGLSAWGLSWPAVQRQLSAAEEGKTVPKSVILLWLWGGPSHIDTFDMKPDAPVEYRGPFAPIPTNVSGIEVCELFPRMSKQANRFTLIRSMHHESNDHGISGTIGLTGSISGSISLGGVTSPGRVQPTHGAIVSRFLGTPHAGLPGFIALGGHLHQGKRPIAGEGGGPLGPLYDPFRAEYVPGEGVKLPQLKLRDDLTSRQVGERLTLLQQFDKESQKIDQSPSIARMDQFYQQAYSLLTSKEARKVFELDGEDEFLRRRYGKFRFGQSCLMARRLVEVGIPFVQVNWSSHVEPIEDTGDGGWDMHDRNFVQMQDRHAWMLDQSLSALLDDLDQRGLLESTMVVAVGEFGRGPRINPKAGRDHWNHCYTALVAGGGLPGGMVIGAATAWRNIRAAGPISLPT